MSLSALLLDEISRSIAGSLRIAETGHCLRVDNLADDDAVKVCDRVREELRGDSAEAYVLDPQHQHSDGVYINPAHAVELRNRKACRLCLLIPSGANDAASSSLANSFAAFDVGRCLAQAGDAFLRKLPDDIRAACRAALSAQRGGLRPAAEQRADFLGAVLQNPAMDTAARNLWRIGLIPDAGGEGWVDRLPENARAVRALIRPPRPHTSPQERLEALHMRAGGTKSELTRFLLGRRLSASPLWLQDMSKETNLGHISFDQWQFDTTGSDLETIEIEPFLRKDGTVEKYTHLQQPGGADAQLHAEVGARGRVVVKWKSTPTNPNNLRHWQAELIPSREEYSAEEAAAADFPTAKVPANRRQAAIRLELDLAEMDIRAVQIRVVGLDEYGSVLTGPGNKPVEGLSEEFWLSQDDGGGDLQPRVKRETSPTIPYARLKTAVETKCDSIEHAPGIWAERAQSFYTLRFNGSRSCTLEVSSVLRRFEERLIRNPDDAGWYRLCIDAAERFDDATRPEFHPIEDLECLAGFLKRRKDVFTCLQKQPSAIVETADFDKDLCRKVRAYVASFRELVEEGKRAGKLQGVLALDTLEIRITGSSVDGPALLIAPVHPLRLLWYAAYVELLRHWEEQVLAEPNLRQRKALVDTALLERITPLNCPAVAVSADGLPYLFAQNLRVFWGVALPPGDRDAARHIADTARVLGYDEDVAALADLPPARFAKELDAYRRVHPYLETLRLNVVNPGSGRFVADALRSLFEEPATGDDESEMPPPPKLEVICHAHKPLPLRMGALEALRRDVYEQQHRTKRQFLSPTFSLALRPTDSMGKMSGGDVNLSLLMDHMRPEVKAVTAECKEDSASFYGLLIRLLPEFECDENGATWRHLLSFPKQAVRERHPAYGPYTTELADTHQVFLNGVARVLDPSVGVASMPAVVSRLEPHDRMRVDLLHESSDWVVTLDRFLGVEFFDNPGHPELSRVAHRYLLDYAPEFLEGLGHRLLVTTSHRQEVEEMLSGAMNELGFGMVEESVGEVLQHLKTVSGRLALRVIGDANLAREAVSLGVVAVYLRSKGELEDSILVPVDAHPELFGPSHRQKRGTGTRQRCDMLKVSFNKTRMVATLIEVKSRSAAGASDELLNRIVDQIEATKDVIQDLFFRHNPPRLDHVLQRSRLVTILRFYLRRAQRYGLLTSQEAYEKLNDSIAHLEAGIPDMRVNQRGFVVNLGGHPQKPTRLRDTTIEFITAADLLNAGLSHTSISLTSDREPLCHEAQVSAHREDSAPDAHLSADISTAGSEAAASGSAEKQSADETADSNHHDVLAVELGDTEVEQNPVCWTPGVVGSPHLFILGIPGQGKSWTVTRILCELAKSDVSCLVFDFHGQFGEPSNPFGLASAPVVWDAAHGLPFTPFEGDLESRGEGWRTSCFTVAEIFQYVCELGDIQRDVVYQALCDCYEDVGFGGDRPERLPTVEEVKTRIGEVESERAIRNVLPRCRPLLDLGLFKDVASDNGALQGILQQSHVLDLHNLNLEVLQLAAGAFLLRKVYKEMFRWGEADRLRLVIVLDEAHRLAKDISLPKLMKEGRKFGVAVVVASQGLADYHPDVVGNAGTKVIFRTNFPMSRKVAGFLRARKGVDLPQEIEQLDVGEAYVQTPEMNSAARVRMRPLDGTAAV